MICKLFIDWRKQYQNRPEAVNISLINFNAMEVREIKPDKSYLIQPLAVN